MSFPCAVLDLSLNFPKKVTTSVATSRKSRKVAILHKFSNNVKLVELRCCGKSFDASEIAHPIILRLPGAGDGEYVLNEFEFFAFSSRRRRITRISSKQEIRSF